MKIRKINTKRSGWMTQLRTLSTQMGGPFRAPHHTVNELGGVAEVAAAAGGILLLTDAHEFQRKVLGSMLRTAAGMDHRFRPVIYMTTDEAVPDWLTELINRHQDPEV